MNLSPGGRPRLTRDDSRVVTQGRGIRSYESAMTRIFDYGPFSLPIFLIYSADSDGKTFISTTLDSDEPGRDTSVAPFSNFPSFSRSVIRSLDFPSSVSTFGISAWTMFCSRNLDARALSGSSRTSARTLTLMLCSGIGSPRSTRSVVPSGHVQVTWKVKELDRLPALFQSRAASWTM